MRDGLLLTEVVAGARVVVLLERRVQSRVDSNLQLMESCNPSQSADSQLGGGKDSKRDTHDEDVEVGTDEVWE